MAENDPQYVRLPDRVVGDGFWSGVLHDVESGWGVSGYDVVEFPDPESDPEAYRFARNQLRLGNLEPASAEEYQVIRDADNVMAELHPVGQHVEEGSHWPENVLASHSRQHHNRIRAARDGNVTPKPGQEPAQAASGGAKAGNGGGGGSKG